MGSAVQFEHLLFILSTALSPIASNVKARQPFLAEKKKKKKEVQWIYISKGKKIQKLHCETYFTVQADWDSHYPLNFQICSLN